MKRRPLTYHPAQQHWGTYLLGFPWNIYGCGTYRNPIGEVGAEFLMKRFMERLRKKVGAPVSYFAALEHRYSGCGMPPTPAHWHFVAACQEAILKAADELWREKFGIAEIKTYDAEDNGVYYICKTAGEANEGFLCGNMDLLEYKGPDDLLAAACNDPYVPDHLKDKTHGEYLAVR